MRIDQTEKTKGDLKLNSLKLVQLVKSLSSDHKEPSSIPGFDEI